MANEKEGQLTFIFGTCGDPLFAACRRVHSISIVADLVLDYGSR